MELFKVTDMTCGGCASKVTAALKNADPQCEVQVDLPSQEVRVQSELPRPVLAQALEGAGFSPA